MCYLIHPHLAGPQGLKFPPTLRKYQECWLGGYGDILARRWNCRPESVANEDQLCVSSHLSHTKTGQAQEIGVTGGHSAVRCQKRQTYYCGRDEFPSMSSHPTSLLVHLANHTVTPVFGLWMIVALQDLRRNPWSPGTPFFSGFYLALVLRLFITFEFTENLEIMKSILH